MGWLRRFNQRRYSSTAKCRNVRDHPAPNLVAFSKSGFIYPGRASADKIILDAKRACRAVTFDNACRDSDQSTMADDPKDFLLLVHLTDEVRDNGVSAQLIRCPAAGNNQGVQIICV